jgi:hypothetical protein
MATRPETHQNLIHPDKEPAATTGGSGNGTTKSPGRIAQDFRHTELEHSAILSSAAGSGANSPAWRTYP